MTKQFTVIEGFGELELFLVHRVCHNFFFGPAMLPISFRQPPPLTTMAVISGLRHALPVALYCLQTKVLNASAKDSRTHQ